MLSRRLLSVSMVSKRTLPALGPSNAQPTASASSSATMKPSVRKNSSKPPAPEPQSDPSAPAMLRFEPFLPNLPVPPLSHTLPLYLSTLSPHLTADELASSKRAVDKFAASELAQTLQSRLEHRAKAEGRDSWLAEWWDEVAYMSYRDPVVPYVNYFYTHRGTGGEGKTQTRRAAELIRATDVFRDLVESQQLEPERARTTPLAMSSLKNLFNASRIPVIPSDLPKKYPTADGQNDHVIILRKNRYFEVRVGGLGVDEIERLLNEIVAEVGDVAGKEQIGVLTAANRDVWSKAREHLFALSPTNKATIEKIEAATVVVALDDTEPFKREETEGEKESRLVDLSWRVWVGEQASNRWFDKHQYIVTPSAHSGFNGEHSMLDGTPTLRMNEFVLASLDKGRIELEPVNVKPHAAPKGGKARELEWVVDEQVRNDVAGAREAHVKLMGDHQMEALHYTGYGKDLIKKFKTSPDAWAQMVKHLAFFKMENRMGVCYESAQTRKFKLGRTEVIRSASQEAKDWIESMLDSSVADSKRVELFRQACARHLTYAALAADGKGVDRHLFGLRMLLEEGETKPEIFTDPAYARTSHWEMSTSSLLSDYLDGWGYGEVVEDGYGLAYSVGDHFLRWVITARKTQKAREYKQCLEWACVEVRGMMERAECEAASAAGASSKAKL